MGQHKNEAKNGSFLQFDYDACYFYDGIIGEPVNFDFLYDGFGGNASVRVLFYDVDRVGELESFSFGDVPNVFVELNITG